MMEETREEALENLIKQANELDANVLFSVKFDSNK
ncbi:hypothetical protein MBBAR_6c00230 [Methanobrevibacter arboriphilus JCM 13429 = DSM 1125]|uniref:Uncharacterized protein n=1 Tax=Methanobrevibacter arboriphilus JCM 13429 = DSM 1125 TaxID=1300164 RepID=A0A1V6N2X8_METAZ|nr:heavy metal-binding domain-containing protein [Methanobrevibacter arboriphilus]OQD58913.1 hypothetical protein MBBAR_6c00230 [Methanobrevibacter arboriphilus JCM 13429 = DSM 1125]